jgi:hypothetical protein
LAKSFKVNDPTAKKEGTGEKYEQESQESDTSGSALREYRIKDEDD